MNLPPTRLALALVLATALSGCATWRRHSQAAPALPAAFTAATAPAELAPIDPSLLQRPTSAYRLGPGDKLEIEVLGDVDTRSITTVGPDGKIYFYMLPGLDVWGDTVAQVRDKIIDGLQKFIREKQPVSVTLLDAESERVWILGRLNKPGVYPLSGPTTLLEAIAEAGGLSPRSATASFAGATPLPPAAGIGSDEAADLSRAFVIRHGQMLHVDFTRLLHDGDLSQNIYLEPDDFIYLPAGSTGSVHVLGAVFEPRALSSDTQLTLVKAVADAGGTIKNAYLSHVAIVRGSLSQPQVAVVNLAAIESGQAPDVLLQPQDIVYVPFTPYRVLTRYVDMILDTFARTVGVNEGARVISNQAVPVGVNVPVNVSVPVGP
ncbi:MAG TPA: SLBB domain-containing protein [Opitutaceae bacterium]|nr:SLBB domain-containing protein [Opitutaceae bacterium]